MVKRPEWLWDSRAPFHQFFKEHARFNRRVGSLAVAAEHSVYRLRQAASNARAVRKTLHIGKGSDRATRGWMMFSRSTISGSEAIDPNRCPELFERAVADAGRFVSEAAIVAYSSMFETYVLCWALNFLLSHLEERIDLGKSAQLIEIFQQHPRQLNAIVALKAFPEIWKGLAGIPHVFSDRATGLPATQPVDEELNALRAVLFWRHYRNHVVHRSALVTPDFEQTYRSLWEKLRWPYRPYVPRMRTGVQLYFSDDLVRSCFTVHYRAAKWLREELVRISRGRRGHVLAPGAPRDDVIVEPGFVPKPLLMDDDHAPSVRAARAGSGET